jgi:P-type Ca2+ transporter type 2C
MSSRWDITSDELFDVLHRRDEPSAAQELADLGSLTQLADKLKTDVSRGLSDPEEYASGYSARKKWFGENRLPEKPPRSLWQFWFDALQDRTLIILMTAAVVSIILGLIMPPPGESRSRSWIDGAAILFAVAIISGVTATNDYKKELQFRELSNVHKDKKVKVVRNHKQMVISTFDLIVGDIVALEGGDSIPADMFVVTSHGLVSDESSFTGEPEGQHKAPLGACHGDSNSFLLSGCLISEGTGTGVVIGVGVKTQFGAMMSHTSDDEEEDDDDADLTPLQRKLNNLAELIGQAGLIAAILTFAALFIKWLITFWMGTASFQANMLGTILQFVITSVTIVVVAVPEGLPLAVTLSLAYSMIQMMKDNNLVRHLTACETMGGATVICSDKTGTLTQNLMTVVRSYLAGLEHDDKGPVNVESLQSGTLLHTLTAQSISLNGQAYIVKKKVGRPEFIGPKTECALLTFSEKLGINYDRIRKQVPAAMQYPFSSEKKRSSALVQARYVDGDLNPTHFYLFVKGASEVLLGMCINEAVDAQASHRPLSDDKRAELANLIEIWASQGLRTLCLGFRKLTIDGPPSEPGKAGACPYDGQLTLLSIVGIEDPLRPEVPRAVDTCKRAGIRVRMLTGDNILTAQSIARRCGIMSPDGIAMEGPVFRTKSSKELDDIVPKLDVLARCSPEDKFLLVTKLQEMGEIVAVTGDGTNDAPQLRQAHIGFAMGISGTEVAKDASDIILLDDNFASIVKAVMWGRNVNDSIRKFLQFQMAINICAVILAFIGALTKGDSPLKPVQLLWVNLIMDTAAALALATEPPTPALLLRQPDSPRASLITWRMWRFIMGHAFNQLFIFLVLMYIPADRIPALGLEDDVDPHKPSVRNTIIFNVFVLYQVFNEFNARLLKDDTNIFRNVEKSPIFLGVVFGTAAVQALLVQFGGTFASCIPLSFGQWLFCILIAAWALPFGLALKQIPTPDESYEMPLPKWLQCMRNLEDEDAEDDDDLHLVVTSPADEFVEPLPPKRRVPTGKDNWRRARRLVSSLRLVNALRGKPLKQKNPVPN